MAYTSSHSSLSEMYNRLLSLDVPTHEVDVALAALIYLRWADFQESEEEAFAAFEGDDYNPVLPVSLHWRTWHMDKPKDLQGLFAEKLPIVLKGLNNSRQNSLATHLHRIAPAVQLLGRLSPSSLDVMIRWLAEQPFETQNDRRALLDTFDHLLNAGETFDSNRKSYGEFRTPANIARLIIEIAAPTYGERIYDPCFGSAGFLTGAYDYVREKNKDQYSRNGDSLLRIAGVEKNPTAYLIGLTRLALAGVDDPQLELGNSLERLPFSNPQRDGFDLVLLNPPWGGRLDPLGADHFPVRTSDSTSLFIQHALSQLRPQGRAVIIVPEGFLFRSGAEQRLRRILVEQHTVEAVVSLPTAAFRPYTGIKASILVLSRGGQTEQIRMFDADTYFEKGQVRYPATISISEAMSVKLAEHLRAAQPTENSWDVDVATLAEVEWDFSPRRRDKGGLSEVLDAIRPKVEIQLLKDCCRIIIGKAFKAGDLVDDIVNKELIPYVRIKDVERGEATKSSSWLSSEASSAVDVSWKLRAGDLLLSKSGTIGKTGIVRNGAVGAVAASGLFVIRPDQDRIDPHFLLAYLDSSECRAWFEAKARGTTIQHLSKNALEELPIPVPPLQLQRRVVNEQRSYGIDALTYLSQILTESRQDPVAKWLDQADKLISDTLSTVDDPPVKDFMKDLASLDEFATKVHQIRDECAHDIYNQTNVEWWIPKFTAAVAELRSLRNMPIGTGLVSVLQRAARRLQDDAPMLNGESKNERAAKNLRLLTTGWIDKIYYALVNDVKIVLSTDIGALQVGEMLDISLHVYNQGPLPLRAVSITTSPDFGHDEFSYLAENAKVNVNLSGAGPKVAGVFTILATWSGLTLDGQSVNGSRELAFDVRETTSVTAELLTDMGGSPYVCGDPVKPDRKDVFFGREELLDQIRRQIMQSGNVVLLEGNRRSGKSSILWHLEGQNSVPGWMGVYCSLQGTEGSSEREGIPTVEVFRGIAYSIYESLSKLGEGMPLPDGTTLPAGQKLGISKACRRGISEESPFSDFREYIEVVLEKFAQHDLGLLLMLDEFDKLQEGIDSGVTSHQLPENIRFLIHQYPRLSAILTGSHVISRLRDEYWSALFGLSGLEVRVSFLPNEAARRLVIEPVRGRLVYSHEAVELIIRLTAGQPFLLQCLCNRIFALAAQLKSRSVNVDLIQAAIDMMIDGNKYFGNLWEFVGTNRRRLILALAYKESAGGEDFRFRLIQERLLSHGVEVDDDALISDLTSLRELELIKLIGESSGGHYELAIPLMGTWIEKQQDFVALASKARLETEDHND
jgi:type I restriction enzyme M protein